MSAKFNFISKIDFRFVALVILLALFVIGAGAPGATGV
jgi:hypothetical protein